MKTIKIKEWYLNENNWPIEWANMTANMQDYNNPQTITMYNGRRARGNTIPNKPATKRSSNQTVNYSQAAQVMGRPLNAQR